MADAYSNTKKKRDYSRYLINGKKETDKSNSVLNMVRDYVDRKQKLTVSELKKLLDPFALGKKKKQYIIVSIDELESVRSSNYYYSGEDAVKLCDGSVAVLGYWTIDQMPHVENIGLALGCKLKQVK